jgi:hypothetical protein
MENRLKEQVFRPNTAISPLQASEIMRVKMNDHKLNFDEEIEYFYFIQWMNKD